MGNDLVGTSECTPLPMIARRGFSTPAQRAKNHLINKTSFADTIDRLADAVNFDCQSNANITFTQAPECAAGGDQNTRFFQQSLGEFTAGHLGWHSSPDKESRFGPDNLPTQLIQAAAQGIPPLLVHGCHFPRVIHRAIQGCCSRQLNRLELAHIDI